jgi:nucleoside 2-deoxyribosyltransferase
MGRKKTKVIYLIGSLKNRKKIIDLANRLRELGFEVFDDWIAPGPDADDYWRDYEKRRGSSYKQALKNYAATHIFEFDKYHIDRSDMGVLYMPAGKSAHLELGYMIGRGKPCFVLFDEEPERWDVMYQFATAVCFSYEELVKELKKYLK